MSAGDDAGDDSGPAADELPYEFADFIQGVPDQYFCDYALCERGEN